MSSTRHTGIEKRAASNLSPGAIALFRLHVERHGDIAVDDTTRPAYEELRRAGLVAIGHTFAKGRNSVYKLTKEGFERKAELCGRAKESA
jgi:hypothetical protein